MTGALDSDLAAAARRALKRDPRTCRERAVKSGWDLSTREFEGNLVLCRPSGAAQMRVRETAQADAAACLRRQAPNDPLPADPAGFSRS